MRVGWIGLGAMGAPMALAVRAAGHDVRGYARRPAEHGALAAAGAMVTDDIREAVAEAEIVCLNLFSERQIRDVMTVGGALGAVPANAVVVIHSTVSPDFVRDFASLRPEIATVDAGFSGGPEDAASGRLTLMVGGEGEAVGRARPVLSAYADHIAHAGPLGSGMALKVINNLAFAANLAIARDALRLVREHGIDLAVATATLGRGSAGSNALAILARSRDPMAAIATMARFLDKDVPIARAAAAACDLGSLDAATREFGREERP